MCMFSSVPCRRRVHWAARSVSPALTATGGPWRPAIGGIVRSSIIWWSHHMSELTYNLDDDDRPSWMRLEMEYAVHLPCNVFKRGPRYGVQHHGMLQINQKHHSIVSQPWRTCQSAMTNLNNSYKRGVGDVVRQWLASADGEYSSRTLDRLERIDWIDLAGLLPSVLNKCKMIGGIL